MIPSVTERRTFVIKQSIGASVALVPWDLPVAMVVRRFTAALAAGSVMIVKLSSEIPLTALALADLPLRADSPPGAFNIMTTVNANTSSVGEALCKIAFVRKVTFTGSTNIGQLIARY